jgi:hypothetical protein
MHITTTERWLRRVHDTGLWPDIEESDEIPATGS